MALKSTVAFTTANLFASTALAQGVIEPAISGDALSYAGYAVGVLAAGYIGGTLLTVAGRRSLAPELPKPGIQDLLPLIRIENDGYTVVCERPDYSVNGRKDVGKYDLRFVVIECEGINYASTSPEKLESFRRARVGWQARMAETETAAMVIFDRKLMEISLTGVGDNEWLRKVNQRWGENFKNAFSNRSYIILIDEGSAKLQTAITDTLTIYEEAKPKLLRHFHPEYHDIAETGETIKAADSDLWRFLYDLVNTDMPVRRILNSDDLPASLSGCDFEFDDQLGELRNTDGIRERFHKYLVLTKIEKERVQTDQRLIRRLMTLDTEITLHLCLRPRDGFWSKSKLKERRANREISDDGVTDKMKLEFEELGTGFSEGEDGFTETEVIIAVHSDSRDGARRAADTVVDAFTQDDNFRAAVACFTTQNEWERRLPSGGRPIRELNLGRNSVADWTPFEGTPRGRDACWWGPHPLRLARTPNGAAYALGIHEHSREEALGNLCLIGKSGSGKTVTASWLATGALSNFPDMRIICFDNMNGLTVSTLAHGGAVVSPGISRFAPLQIEDNPENRSFLISLLMEMSGCSKNDEQDEVRRDQLEIEQGLDLIMGMQISDRTLQRFVDQCVRTNSAVGRGLAAWVGTGAYAGWMDGENDSLNLSASRWITFDMTQLLQQPDICSIYMSYVMHRIQHDLWRGEPTSHIIFIDEAPTMFDMSPLLMETGKYIARNIRKKKGAVWFAFQDVEGMGDAGSVIVRSCATLAFWRDPSLKRDRYKEEFNLSDSDIRFIADEDETTRHLRRAALFVHKSEGGQESTPVNLSLNSLGDYLALFRSGEDAAEVARSCILEFGENLWVQPYIERMRVSD